MLAFVKVPMPLLITGSALVVLIAAFVIWFLAPAVRHWFRLRSIERNLRAATTSSPQQLKAIFSGDRQLLHLWKQYEETLHEQTEDRGGIVRTIAVRSTIPAETFFNSQYVVDSRLHTEFFRHLPGIFTGVGIIGTFSGLIMGLKEFQSGLETAPGGSAGSSSASAIGSAIGGLLHEVYIAFLVSASAITAAMFVTLIEKFLIASLYRRVESIAQNIDARFE